MVSISHISAQRRGAFIASPPIAGRPAAEAVRGAPEGARSLGAPVSRPCCDGANRNEGHARDRSVGVVAVPVYVGVDAGTQPAAAAEDSSQSSMVPAPIPPVYSPANPMPEPCQETSHVPPPPPDPPYVLIALKNGWIYSAIAYWVEGRTLHYLTFEMRHNQVPLDLVDRKISARLNRDSELEFKLPPE